MVLRTGWVHNGEHRQRISLLPGLHLPRVLEPLLVLRRLLPALVGGAGADQVQVGPEVTALLAGSLTGAAGSEAKIVLKVQWTLEGPGVLQAPKLFPVGQIRAWTGRGKRKPVRRPVAHEEHEI